MQDIQEIVVKLKSVQWIAIPMENALKVYVDVILNGLETTVK